ncbi:MAG: hypothetical protein HYU84_11615 [Chloroflexi bacterium]|nr:hypothetical protein [Chloroflexota bacterium]MBI3170215.1 hypothetical protein [Chloroflexota bacterium]
MKRARLQRDKMLPLLFGLTDDSVEYRNRIRTYAHLAVWFILSGLTMVLFIFLAKNNIERITVLVISFIKYLPLLAVIMALGKTKAASYLADIFELEDESIAYNFIDEVAFGYGSDQITINEGKISDKDERSPIILIGGPGYIQVNLDSVALLERVDGAPEIIHPRGKPWKLGRFERIREIGKYDEVGKREYAIINLRDQFVRGLSVKSRTKDGIPLEAQDIKVLFSILRKPKDEAPENDPYHFDENAVYSLVYNQTIITPPPSKTAGVSFPWDTTVIPLITSELENLITSRNLSEILASISHKEIDALNENEATNKQMRIEMTGEHTAPSGAGSFHTPNFESRSKITAQFFSDEFKAKAAKLGVAIHWIDIGTWQLPSEMILEELKGGWQMMRENTRRRGDIERLAKRHEMQELIALVNNVIVSSYSKSGSSSSSRKLSDKEFLQLAKIVEDNPEIAFSPMLQQRFSQDAATKKDMNTNALDILKAFRKEFIVARELIQRENRSSIEKQADISRIDKALRDIDYHVFHYIKGAK